MIIAVNHSTINSGKTTVNHANSYPYCFKTFETNAKFSVRDIKQSILSFIDQHFYELIQCQKKIRSCEPALKHKVEDFQGHYMSPFNKSNLHSLINISMSWYDARKIRSCESALKLKVKVFQVHSILPFNEGNPHSLMFVISALGASFSVVRLIHG